MLEKKEEEKKRKADETGAVDKKKKRESIVEGASRSGSRRKGEEGSRRPPVGPEEVERKKSVKKRETIVADGELAEDRRRSGAKKKEPLLTDGEASDLSERSERRRSVRSDGEKTEKRKSIKKRTDITADKDAVASESDRTEKKKITKKRETSLTRDYSGSDKPERRKSTRKKESVVGKDDSETSMMNGERVKVEDEHREEVMRGEKVSKVRESKVDVTKEDQASPQVKNEELGKGARMKGECKTEPMEVDESLSKDRERSKSAESNEGTLKASDSSLSRESVSPVKQAGLREDTPQGKKSPTPTPQAAKVRNKHAQSLVTPAGRGSMQGGKIDHAAPAPTLVHPRVDQTESILKETADKIKKAGQEVINIPKVANKPDGAEAGPGPGEPVLQPGKQSVSSGESVTSRDISQSSSLLSTPARSRAGSESSTEALSRPPRPDPARRQSKIFKAAALWESQCGANQQTTDTQRRPSRTGGQITADLTKKFEERPSVERKSKVVPSLKVIPNQRCLCHIVILVLEVEI